MNSSEDEPLSGLNSRLRPRRRTTSPQSKSTKKAEGSIAQDKPKRTSTPSRALPNKPEDLTIKPDSFPNPQHLCPYCDRKFASKQTVSKHARRIHLSISKQDFFIACLFCNHTEAEAGDIIRHMVDSHPNQYFACLDCQTRFSSTSELAEHKLNVCERQKPYRSKLRQKTPSTSKKAQKNVNIDRKDDFQSNKEYMKSHGFNGIVISCELKPSQIHDETDIEDNITTNLILPPSKSLANSTVIEKNAVIVLDDIQWNKRIPPNFSFHNTDADQILSRLGVVHRSPRTGESTRRDWFKTIDDSTQKFEKCFETSFYSKVASNVAENLAKCLDGSFNFNPDLENTIKTRKAKNSVVINTAEGFPVLLACQQYSRNMFDSYMPRSIAPKHKWKWDSPESDKSLMNADQIKRDSHTNNCIITLVSSLDIWTQLSMRKKFENKYNISHVEKKTEKQSMIDKELKEILESREIPTTSSTQMVTYSTNASPVRNGLDFPSYLGLAPSAPTYNLQPAVLSGEWVRPRCYVCCACGAQTRDSRALSSHISIQHPNAQVQHYEIVGEPLLNADILKHLYVPPSQVHNRTRPLRGIRDCTKCKKSVTLKELHQHMLDCAGDTPAVRRKCRYRPFGVRRRRPRLPDNVIRRKIRKDLRNRHKQSNHMRPRQKIRSEVGDAETIRKMIADLPAKRHRVVVNPMNPTLRPRRKLDKQRGKLLMKHRLADDSKSRKLRSIKDLNNSTNSVNMPPNKEEENKSVPNHDDEDNKPLKPTRRPTETKNTRNSDTIKRKTVLNRAKRKIQMKNISIAKAPDLNTEDAVSNLSNEDLAKNNAPEKIDVNNSQYSSRQLTGRGGNYNRGNNSRGNNRRGNNERGNYDRGNNNRGNYDRGNNNRANTNRGNDNHRNNDRGREQGSKENNGDDKDKMNSDNSAKNEPLKHSMAALTAESKTKDKSLQSQSTDQQDDQHLPTRQAELFENEAADSRLDKPPLPCNQKVPIDPQKNKSSKTRKGKGLNDCIAMLKNKLEDPPVNIDTNENETAHTNDNPAADLVADPAAQERVASEDCASIYTAAKTAVHEEAHLAEPVFQQDTQLNPQAGVQKDERNLALSSASSAETNVRIVTQTAGNIEATPADKAEASPPSKSLATVASDIEATAAGETEATPASDTKATVAGETEATSTSDTELTAAGETKAASAGKTEATSAGNAESTPASKNEASPPMVNDASPGVETDASPAVETAASIDVETVRPVVLADNLPAVPLDACVTPHTTAQTEAPPALQLDVLRDIQPEARPAPFAHQFANLAANPTQHSAEHSVAKPDALATPRLPMSAADHLALRALTHQHTAVYSTIRPEFQMSQYAAYASAHQAQLAAAQYRSVNPIDPNPRFYLPSPFDPKIDSMPAEFYSRSMMPPFMPHNMALDQVSHSLPMLTENQTTPPKESGVNNRGRQRKSPATTTQPKRTPARRKSTRLTSRSNVQPILQQNMYGLSPLEMIPQPPLGSTSLQVLPFHDQYANLMISPDSDKNKQRKQTINTATDTHQMKNAERAEYHHTFNMSGGQLIENKSYQQPVGPEQSSLTEQHSSTGEQILEDHRNEQPRLAIKKRVLEGHWKIGQQRPLDLKILEDQSKIDQREIKQQQHEQQKLELQKIEAEKAEQLRIENQKIEQQKILEDQRKNEQQKVVGQAILEDQRKVAERWSEIRTNSEQRTEQSSYPDPKTAPSEFRAHSEHRLPIPLIQADQRYRLPSTYAYPEQRSFLENRPLLEQRPPYPGIRPHIGQNIYPDPQIYPNPRSYAEQMTFQPPPSGFSELRSNPFGQTYPDPRLSLGLSGQTVSQELGIYPEQRQHLQQTSYLEPGIYPDNRSIAENTAHQQLLNDQMLPPEPRPRISSKEKKSASERRVSNIEHEHWLSERGLSNDHLSLQEQNIFKEQNITNDLRLSLETPIEHRLSAKVGSQLSMQLQVPAEPPVSGEQRHLADPRLSAEQQQSADQRFLAGQRLLDEQRQSAERRLSAEHNLSADRQMSLKRRLSVDRLMSLDRQRSIENRPSVDRQLSSEREPSCERSSLGQELSSEGMPSFERGPSCKRPSLEKEPSCELSPSFERGPSFEQMSCEPSIEQRHSSNRGISNDQRPSNEQYSTNEQPLNELSRPNEHAVNSSVPSSQHYHVQFSSINQQIQREEHIRRYYTERVNFLEKSIKDKSLQHGQMLKLISDRETEQNADQELMMQNNSLREEETSMDQQTYRDLNPHSDSYIEHHMSTNIYHGSALKPPTILSDEHVSHKAQDKLYMKYIYRNIPSGTHLDVASTNFDNISGPLDLSAVGRTFPQECTAELPVNENINTTMSHCEMSKYVSLDFSKQDQTVDRISIAKEPVPTVDLRVKSFTQSTFQMSDPIQSSTQSASQMSEYSSTSIQSASQMSENIKSSTQSTFQMSDYIKFPTQSVSQMSDSKNDSDDATDFSVKPGPKNVSVRSLPRNESSENNEENVTYDYQDFSSRTIVETEPEELLNTMNDASHLSTDLQGEDATTSDLVDVPERKDICFSIDLTVDEESLLDIMSTEDTENQFDSSLDVKTTLVNTITELPSSETNIIYNDENTQQLNTNVSVESIIMPATEQTLRPDTVLQRTTPTISANLDPCAAQPETNFRTAVTSTFSNTSLKTQSTSETLPNTFSTCSLNPMNDAISSLPVYTLPNPAMATTVLKHENTEPVYTLADACISVTKIESSDSVTLTDTLLSVAGTTTANTTSVYTLAGTSPGEPFNYRVIQSSSQMGPTIGNSNMQTLVSKETTDKNSETDVTNTAVNKVDASTATNETPDPDTARRIAMFPQEIADALIALPAENRDKLLKVLPNYVTTKPRNYCENQNMFNMIHAFFPNYQLPASLQHGLPQFKRSFNMDENHPISYLPPPPLQQFTMLPPPPPPPPLSEQDELQLHPTLQTQTTFVPPLPPNTPPPLLRPLLTIIKTDDTEEDVKPPVMSTKMKEEKDLESENNNSFESFQPGPSAAPENNTESEHINKEIKVIDLTEEESSTVRKIVKLADDPAIIPTQQATNLMITPKQKALNDKTASLRAVRIKTPSERNKSSTENPSQNRSNTESEVPLTARAAVDKEVQQCSKTTSEPEIEKHRESPAESDKQPMAKTSEETRSIIDQVQDFEGEDSKLLQWKISLAIQQAEISSTQQNNRNKTVSSKLPTTITPVASTIRPENFINNDIQNPAVPTNQIVTKKDTELIENSIPRLRNVTSCISQQDNHILDCSNNSTTTQNYESLDGAEPPSKDNNEPKNYDKSCKTNTVVERLTSENTTTGDGNVVETIKHYNTLDEDDSDDDLSLAVIVKNRDQLKNQTHVDNLCVNKSANASLDEETKEDTVLKETTNNLNKDRTIEPSACINDKPENKQEALSSATKMKETLQGNKVHLEKSVIKEIEKNQPTITNNRKKTNGTTDQKLQDINHSVSYMNNEEIQIAKNIITLDKIIDKETANSIEQQIQKPQSVSENLNQPKNSMKKIVEDETKKSSLVSLKPNDKDMLQTHKEKQKKKTKLNLSTPSINNDDLTHTKMAIGKKTVSLKTINPSSHEIQSLVKASITESRVSIETNISSKESSSVVDVTDHLQTGGGIKEVVVIESNKKSLETNLTNDLERSAEIDENVITPLRRSRRGKSTFLDGATLTEDEILDEPEVSTEQKTPLTKKQLIFSKLLLDEEIQSGPQAHSTPEKDISPVEANNLIGQKKSVSSPTAPISDVTIEQNQITNLGKRKRTKRKKSVQLRRLCKKKRIKKNSKIRLHSESSANSDQTQNQWRTMRLEDKEKFDLTENKIHRSNSANEELGTTTDKLNLLSGSTTINENLNTSGEKRKLESADGCSQITKTKKLKFLDNCEQDLEEKHDIHVLNSTGKEKVLLSSEKRTACYMPVAARRTRSKSVIVKSSTTDFYDPYDIDLDDMIEKPGSFRSKINLPDKNTQNSKTQNYCKSKSKLESCSKTQALTKNTLKPTGNLIQYSNKIACSKNNVTDSDDSTKSDVPLKKYIEEKEKKSLQSRKKRNVNSEKQVKGNKTTKSLKRNRRTLATFNDVDKSTTPNDAEELRSEKFMESFGFFSQRKPRKSNLLASKKISETFHIIANESDDAYFGSKRRTQKRSLQNENKKSVGAGDARPRRQFSNKRIIKRIPKAKKKVFVQPVPSFCRVCKKEFRRPDCFMRHQLTVVHASKISEVELKMRTIPLIEKPNYLIEYKRQLDRLKLLTKKYANMKNNSKCKKFKLPTLDKILAKVNKKVREQQLAQRGLSRDEALFIDCCQLLKSNKNEINAPEPTGFNTVANHFSESTVKEFDLLEKPVKGDGDVDSITAKNILESEEVKNLEKDLISGLKEAANEGSFKTKILYQRSVSDVGLNQTDDEQIGFPSSKVRESNYEHTDPYPVTNPTKTKKQPEVKEKMYPDIIESIDMFEDKFDKIKRKCRSQAAAAAAKQTLAAIEPSASFKCRKKSEKKKARRNFKKSRQSSQVLTKGALKGFDGIKVSIPTSDINISAIVPSITSPKKKKKGNRNKKEKVSETSSKLDNQRHFGDGMTSQKEVDVYEFLDNEDAVFEFRPSTLMERFKSINNKEAPNTSKVNSGGDEADNSSDSVSDGDDFVYMSDDYVCSDDETENSLLSCEFNNGKVGCDLKKNTTPLKRKDAVEKNAVMGKIFKHNAVLTNKRSIKVREAAKPKANLDQLFDSLLEEEQELSSSILNSNAVSPKKQDFVTPKKHDHPSKSDKYNRTLSSKCSSPTFNLKSPSPTPKSPKDYDSSSPIDYGPSTLKTSAIDLGPSTSKTRDVISPDLSPKKYESIKKHEAPQKYTSIKHSESSLAKSNAIPIKKRDSKKEKSPSNKLDEGISTSYDYNADAFDQYDVMGVARQRARRKCTVGKQNVLAETWSSESEPDGIPPRPNSAESVVLTSARRKKGKKREGHHASARRMNNRHISFKKLDVESRLASCSRNTASGSDAGSSRARRDSDAAGNVNAYDQPTPSTSTAHALLGPPGPKPRPRTTAYYNWSSEGDDEPEHVQQHGWIVGDSHKKLVTMLAHAKGRKRNNDDKRHFVE